MNLLTRAGSGRIAAGAIAVTLAATFAVSLSACASEGTYTVLDSGEGPMLCETVRESYPPQCDGPFLVEWDWDEWPHEEASGVRWGEFRLKASHDGDRVRVSDVHPVTR